MLLPRRWHRDPDADGAALPQATVYPTSVPRQGRPESASPAAGDGLPDVRAEAGETRVSKRSGVQTQALLSPELVGAPCARTGPLGPHGGQALEGARWRCQAA